MSMYRLLALLSVLLLGACAAPQRPSPSEKLYLALEVRHEGKLVGKPKLLGESGKVVRVERRQPGAPQADYRLVIAPAVQGEAFKIKLEVEVPKASGHGNLALLHGEERKLVLDGDLEVKLLLMKVDSPEFRALMELSDLTVASGPTSI
ncbi:MAG: hypothetical protein HYZ28_05130 [Myxococcales bacterium]|nr:hypothetical protein [Myxococcales bacterium]